jgi:hypothetical protein
MARKVSTQGRKDGGAPVKISVSLDPDTYLRLRCLATMRRTPASEIVAALVVQAVAKVRLPTTGDAEGDAGNAA